MIKKTIQMNIKYLLEEKIDKEAINFLVKFLIQERKELLVKGS